MLRARSNSGADIVYDITANELWSREVKQLHSTGLAAVVLLTVGMRFQRRFSIPSQGWPLMMMMMMMMRKKRRRRRTTTDDD